MHCPVCGQSTTAHELDIVLDDGNGLAVGWTDKRALLTPIQARIMTALIRARAGKRTCRTEALVDAAWTHPDDVDVPEHVLQVHLRNIRKRIAPLGLAIRNVYAVGYELDRAGA